MEPLEEILKRTFGATSKESTKTSSSTDGAGPAAQRADLPEPPQPEPPQPEPPLQFDGPGRPDCPICHGMGYVRQELPLSHPQFGKLQICECRQAEVAARRLAQLRALSNLAALNHYTFASFIPEPPMLPKDKRKNLREAYEAARRYAADPQGWLIVRGGYGCGKTHLAAAIANARVEQGLAALFVNVPDLLDYLRASFSPAAAVPYDERFELVRNCELLVLDDLGTESATAWAQEKLYQIFNTRYALRLPTVITTNHELEEIDIRLRSRMVDDSFCQIVPITAPDYRQAGVDQDHSELSSLDYHGDKTFAGFDLRASELPRDKSDNLRRALEKARSYAQAPRDWLVFTGPYGCGKTHLAAAIANAYREHTGGGAVLFVVVPDLLDHLRAAFSPHSPVSYDKRFEEVRSAPLLILDDLGTESATAWAREKLYQLLNHRYNARLPTVITMVNSLEEFDQVDPRLATRLADVSRCTVFAIQAPSYRGGPASRRKKRA